MERPSRIRVLTLKRAAEIAGGVDALAAKLQVESEKLNDWINGLGNPPETVFLDAADIFLSGLTRR